MSDDRPESGWLDSASLARALGIPGRRVTQRVYHARLHYAGTGQWPDWRIPRPDVGVTSTDQARWDPDRVDVQDYIATQTAARGVDTSGWWTVTDMASRLGVPPGTVLSRLHAARQAEDDTGERPAGMPEPDLDRDPVSGRKRLLWDPARADVQAILAPPETRRPTSTTTARKGPAARPQATSGQAGRAAQQAAARAAHVAAAHRVLASGVRLSPLQRTVLEGRVTHPELTMAQLADVIGVPRGSMSELYQVLARHDGR